MYIDLAHEKIDPEWSLPVPNQDAAYKSLAKYGKATVVMENDDVEKLNLAWTYVSRQFLPYMGEAKVLSLDESISRLDMSSGSGSPFNEEFSKKGELFENDPQITEWLENDWENLAEDPFWTTVFSSCLKEELRPKLKVIKNSIRTFAAGATDATTHGNRLFADMNEKMYDSHLTTASTIGMTPLKGNWNRLYEKLNVFENGYALDESEYDSSLREFMMWGCAKFRWQCLREEDRTLANLRRIKTYYRNLIHTVILTAEGLLTMKKLGNPSGSVNTVTDNTLILYCMLAFAWVKLVPEDMRGYAEFEEHTSKALLGDDNTWTVSDVAHEFYNARTVIEAWKVLGITTTTDSLEPRRAEDLDFLSAHTVFLKGMAVPLYNRDKLMKSLLYAPQLHLTPETTLTRVTCLLQVGWTDLQFRKFCRSLIKFLLEKYDELLMNDQRWIMAKCQIQSDEFYYSLFTGTTRVCSPQSYQESKERLSSLIKQPNMSATGTKPQQQRKRRGNQRRGPKKGNATGKRTTAGPKPAPRGARRPRKRGQLTGKGSSGNTGKMMNRRGCTISEDEFITAVAGSVTFNATQFSINPGQVGTFPWLSQEAKLWEKYTFEHLEFYYKRIVSEFATNGTTGKVMFNVDYDASDAPPGTKTQVEDSFPHKDAMPCENFSLNVNTKQLHPSGSKYVRKGGLPGNSDIKTYDAGNLFVSTEGNQNTSDVGELRVKYRVRFEVPVLENDASAPTNNSVGFFSSANESMTSTVAKQAALSTEVTNGINAINIAGLVTLPAGNYLLNAMVDIHNNVGNYNSPILLQLLKNGVSITQACQYTGPAVQDLALTVSSFATSNGTDYFSIEATTTFGTGGTDLDAQLLIHIV
jgi:hypothetical protein